jgi:U3 small nucleolar RNA-associated protein 6
LTSLVALPKVELFESLKTVLVESPCQSAVRQELLHSLYDLLRNTLPDEPSAIKLLANRFLTTELDGHAFVEGLRRANEEMIQNIKDGSREDILEMYVTFVEEWCNAPIDDNLASLACCYFVVGALTLM